MDESEERAGLDPEERRNLREDLEALARMREAFLQRGMKGVVIDCPDCGQDHFYNWDLLRESLEHMLESGEPRLHEPAFEPNEQDYIFWDYAKGFVDALGELGLDTSNGLDLTRCAWCETPVEDHFEYCPKCGRQLAPLRLLGVLIERGMDEHEARALLAKAGFEPLP